MIDLEKVSHYRVLLVGDAIIDEYIYVKTIGKAIKENALSTLKGKSEEWRGGVWAAAEHVKGFCQHVDVLVGPHIMKNSRLVDDIYLRKLFVTHELVDNPDTIPQIDIGSYDLVIICDFGHGTMTKDLIAKVSKEAHYLAVNAQTNATNFGFNLVTKYARADFVVVDEMEARLAAHDREGEVEDVILALPFKKIIVTRGTKGAVGFDGAFERQPALTERVLDNMGAGDAFLSVTAPFAAAGFSMKDLLKLGNIAGAIKCETVGHRSSVTKDEVKKWMIGR